MKNSLWITVAVAVLCAPALEAQWVDDPTNNDVHTTRKVGVNHAAPADVMHLYAATGLNLLIGDYAAVGTIYSSWSTVIGNNVKAKPTTDNNTMVNIVSHPTYAGAAMVLNGAGGITFHTKEGAATAGATFDSPRMLISPNGNVGIGYTSLTGPGKLAVNGMITTSGDFRRYDGIGGNQMYGWGVDEWFDNANNRLPYVVQHHTGLNFSAHSIYGGIRFFNQTYPSPYNALLAMSITNGNVGIGTTTPAHKLDVNGHMNATSATINSGAVTSLETSFLTRYGGPNVSEMWGWGLDTVRDVAGGRQPYVIQHHQGLNLSAHSTYGGIRFYNQVYPAPYNAVMAMSITNGNVGIGTTTPAAKLDVQGDVIVSGNIGAKYQDLAEWVPATTELTAGTVVVLNADRENEVMASLRPYDTTVAGVVSEMPGVILGEKGHGKEMIATTGRVKVRVDATRRPVKVGDLLVTGDKPGVAMVSTPVDVAGISMHRPGTIIGKALQALPAGEGEILVLLSLQ